MEVVADPQSHHPDRASRQEGRDYATIWNNERDEGPLKTITRSQAEQLAGALRRHPRIVVDWAMRYANPSTESRIRALQDRAATASCCCRSIRNMRRRRRRPPADQAFRALMKMRWQPAVRVAPAITTIPPISTRWPARCKQSLAKLDFEPEKIIATFHGMPQKYLTKGDPYHCQCQKTSRLLREKLGIPTERWLTTFQSRFGNDPWLQPYTDKTVERWPRRASRSLALVAPGFSADCLETLEELDGENRHIFVENGGEKFAYLPALNDSAEGVDVIEAIVRRELMGWI